MVSSKGRIGVAAIVVIIVAVMAVLMLYPHQIEVTSEGEGTVTPSGMQEIRFGECLELDIQSSEGYISEVYVDGVLKGRDVDGFTFKAPFLDLFKAFDPGEVRGGCAACCGAYIDGGLRG